MAQIAEIIVPVIPVPILREHFVDERRSHLHAAQRLEKRIKQIDELLKSLDKDAAQG